MVFVAPIVVTQAEELADMVSWSTGVFQILSAGRTGQLPIMGDWAGETETANRVSAMADSVDCEKRNMSAPHSHSESELL
jgi:hypothetical protein